MSVLGSYKALSVSPSLGFIILRTILLSNRSPIPLSLPHSLSMFFLDALLKRTVAASYSFTGVNQPNSAIPALMLDSENSSMGNHGLSTNPNCQRPGLDSTIPGPVPSPNEVCNVPIMGHQFIGLGTIIRRTLYRSNTTTLSQSPK